jgi:DNA-binding response OmpR family regulator
MAESSQSCKQIVNTLAVPPSGQVRSATITLAGHSGSSPDTQTMQTVLVVDDDAVLRDTISIMLENEGFRPALAQDGRAGFKQALTLKPDLMLVDLRMPGLSGIEVCKQIRAAGMTTPLIVLSAIGDEMDKVLLLEIGADDYVVKPFGTRELLARIRALLRRSSPESNKVLSFGDVEVDLTRRVVRKKGEELKLTRAEYNLLTYFLQNPDRALTRDMILNSVWGYESFPNTRTVDAHVVRLRQKLETDQACPQHLLTVHGVGYRFLP